MTWRLVALSCAVLLLACDRGSSPEPSQAGEVAEAAEAAEVTEMEEEVAEVLEEGEWVDRFVGISGDVMKARTLEEAEEAERSGAGEAPLYAHQVVGVHGEFLEVMALAEDEGMEECGVSFYATCSSYTLRGFVHHGEVTEGPCAEILTARHQGMEDGADEADVAAVRRASGGESSGHEPAYLAAEGTTVRWEDGGEAGQLVGDYVRFEEPRRAVCYHAQQGFAGDPRVCIAPEDFELRCLPRPCAERGECTLRDGRCVQASPSAGEGED